MAFYIYSTNKNKIKKALLFLNTLEQEKVFIAIATEVKKSSSIEFST